MYEAAQAVEYEVPKVAKIGIWTTRVGYWTPRDRDLWLSLIKLGQMRVIPGGPNP